jgi:hypothetical protein
MENGAERSRLHGPGVDADLIGANHRLALYACIEKLNLRCLTPVR